MRQGRQLHTSGSCDKILSSGKSDGMRGRKLEDSEEVWEFFGFAKRGNCFWILALVWCSWVLRVDAVEPRETKPPRMLLSRPSRPSRLPYYSPYDLLNCEGANFSSSWRRFRLKVLDNIRKGFPRDNELLQEATRINIDFRQDAQARSMTQVRVLLGTEPVSKLRDFCLYGFATALLVLFRHSLDPARLLDIHGLMGWDEWPLDFSESSGWPTLWRIAPLHVENLKQRGDASWSEAVAMWGREEELLPQPQLDEVETALLDWLQSDKISPAFFDGLRTATLRPAFRDRDELKVLVAGHHLGSSMEPFTMLQRAIGNSLGLKLNAQFHGQRHPAPGVVCLEFGYCNNDSRLDWWFKRYESRWVGEYEWMADLWPTALQDLAAAVKSDSFLSSTDFMICGGPAWVCSMYRSVHPVPMLLYFAWALVPMIPPALRSHYLWQIQALGHSLIPATVFVAANWVLAAQFAYQVRLNVPVLRVHGLYLNQTYSPVSAPNGFPRVVFSRLGQWTGQAGPALLDMVWAFAKEEQKRNAQGFPFELVFLSIRVRGVKPIMHATYAELAQFYACVFWPWDVMMMLFSELYTMTMPLLVPDRSWMSDIIMHCLRQTEVNWWHIRANVVNGTLPSAVGEEFPLPFEPWISGEGSVAEASYWYSLTEFELFPHVTHFGSLPDMLAKIRSLDVADIRSGMRRFNQRCLSVSMTFYREAAAQLLS